MHDMSTIDAVVFDLGRVLLHWEPDAFYDRTIGPARRKALYDAVDLEAMNLRGDLGEDLADLVEEYAAKHPDFSDDIRMWHRNWADMAAPAIPETAVLLRALKAKGMPVYALTNFGVETLAVAERMYPVLTEFDQRFVSGDLKLVKPDPAIYAVVETETGIAPDRLLFTDDKPENIAAAEARGWHGHLFEGPQGFADRLVAMDLLSAEEARI